MATVEQDGYDYDLGEAQCAVCGYPILGLFMNGELVEPYPCVNCEGDL